MAAAINLASPRLPVPSEAQLQEVRAKARELYGPEIERAKKPAEKLTVVNAVLKTAGESADDPPTRYALLVFARELAISANDIPLALQITSSLAESYAVELLEENYRVLAKCVENPESTPASMTEAANALSRDAAEYAAREDYTNAIKFARLGLEAAKKSRSPALVKQITAQGIDITARQKEAADVAAAEKSLAADPNDAAANMTLGRWHWFRKNDPVKAMPYLAKTAESPLKTAATAELQSPPDAAAQEALADQWWNLAQSIKDESIKNALLQRAQAWYELALPKLTGLNKIKTEKRLAELKSVAAKDNPDIPGGAAGPAVALSPAERLKRAQAEGGSPESEAAVERGLKWLASMQARDGGWSFDTRAINPNSTEPGTADQARNGATGLALMPFLAAGYTHQAQNPYQATIKKGLEFLSKNSNPRYTDLRNGSVSWLELQGTMYSHGIAAAAMCDAYAKTKDKALLPYAQGGLNFIALAQDPNGGGWRYAPRQPGDTSVAGWQFMAMQSGALANLKINPATINLGVKFLDSVSDPQDARASYGYTSTGRGPATTAIGLLCRIQLGWKKDAAGLKPGVEFLTRTGPNKFNNYLNYYTNSVLYQWGGEDWKTWNKALQEQLLTGQTAQGADAGSWHPGSRDHSSTQGGRLYNTALSCLMLEVYYRYPRVLKE